MLEFAKISWGFDQKQQGMSDYWPFVEKVYPKWHMETILSHPHFKNCSCDLTNQFFLQICRFLLNGNEIMPESDQKWRELSLSQHSRTFFVLLAWACVSLLGKNSSHPIFLWARREKVNPSARKSPPPLCVFKWNAKSFKKHTQKKHDWYIFGMDLKRQILSDCGLKRETFPLPFSFFSSP